MIIHSKKNLIHALICKRFGGQFRLSYICRIGHCSINRFQKRIQVIIWMHCITCLKCNGLCLGKRVCGCLSYRYSGLWCVWCVGVCACVCVRTCVHTHQMTFVYSPHYIMVSTCPDCFTDNSATKGDCHLIHWDLYTDYNRLSFSLSLLNFSTYIISMLQYL